MAAKSRFSMVMLRENSALREADELQPMMMPNNSSPLTSQTFQSELACPVHGVSDKYRQVENCISQLQDLLLVVHTCGFFRHSRRHWRYSASTSFCKPDRRMMFILMTVGFARR